jgi:hypothetical protein
MTALAISSGVPSLPSGTMVGIIFNRCWPASDELSRLICSEKRCPHGSRSDYAPMVTSPFHVEPATCGGSGMSQGSSCFAKRKTLGRESRSTAKALTSGRFSLARSLRT